MGLTKEQEQKKKTLLEKIRQLTELHKRQDDLLDKLYLATLYNYVPNGYESKAIKKTINNEGRKANRSEEEYVAHLYVPKGKSITVSLAEHIFEILLNGKIHRRIEKSIKKELESLRTITLQKQTETSSTILFTKEKLMEEDNGEQ